MQTDIVGIWYGTVPNCPAGKYQLKVQFYPNDTFIEDESVAGGRGLFMFQILKRTPHLGGMRPGPEVLPVKKYISTRKGVSLA